MTDLTREQIEQCTYPIGDCVCRAAEPSCKDGGQCGVGGYCVDCPKRAAEQSLREEVERLQKDADHFFQLSGKYLEQRNQAEAEREALRVDADRYRFLADSNNYEESVKLISANLTEYQLDAAIDAAIREQINSQQKASKK